MTKHSIHLILITMLLTMVVLLLMGNYYDSHLKYDSIENIYPVLSRSFLSDSLFSSKEEDDNLSNASIIFIGDSYMVGFSHGEPVTGFATLTTQQSAFSQSIIEAYNGVGWIRENDGNTFHSLLQQALEQLPNPTMIVVAGGYNDWLYDTDTLYSTITKELSWIQTSYPNARIVFGCIGWDAYDGYIQNSIFNMRKVYRQIAAEYDVKYAEEMEKILQLHPEYLQEDGVHPNEEGENVLAKALTAFLQKN